MIGIKAIGTYLPEARTSNFDRMNKFGMTESFVKNKIGFTKVAIKAPEHETSDLCVKAWEDLKNNHPVTPDDIDCVIVCTQNPDGKGLPHTSAILHEKLSLPLSCAVFDISLGCSGYVYGLSVIKSFMEENEFKCGLLFSILFAIKDKPEISEMLKGLVPLNLIESFLEMSPYILTVVILAGFVGRAVAPKAIGQPFSKEK